MEENVVIAKTKKIPQAIIWLVVGLLVGVLGVFLWNTYMVKPQGQAAAQMQQQQAQAQIKELIEKVSALIMLPTGEEPVVATINDAAALIKDQIFYKGAQNGDVVLVYQKASKAIVYSPERNIIVNVGPIFLQDQQAQTPVAPATTSAKKK